MSTLLSKKQNQCYSIEAIRFSGGEKLGLMLHIGIGDGESYKYIALSKQDAIDLCVKIIEGLNCFKG